MPDFPSPGPLRWLNYQHLFYFRTIAMEGGIARAAEKLRLGQPTLSAQLKQLEEMLGKNLFERRNRRMILTESGRMALRYANEIFRAGDELLEVLQDHRLNQQIHLQVGALDSVPKSVIQSLVMKAFRIGPCTVSILEGKGDELFRELYSHRIDIILSNYPPPAKEQNLIHSKLIAKLEVSVFGSSRFAQLKKKFPESLKGQPFVLPTLHSKLRHDLNHFFQVNDLFVATVAETQDTSLQQLLAAGGVGLAPLSEVEGLDGQLVRIGRLRGIYEQIWLVSAQRKLENPIAAQLMKNHENLF